MENVQFVQLERREGFNAPLIVGGILTIVIGGAMILTGYFAVATVGDAVPRGSFTAAQNTTYDDTVSNVFTALSICGTALIFVGIALILVGVRAFGG